jgi:hypothetical protein
MMYLIRQQIDYVGSSHGIVRVWRCIVAAWRLSRQVKRSNA